MKRMLMAIMAVAIAVTFSAPSFAGDEKKKDKDKGGKVVETIYGDDKAKDKDKKGGHFDTYGEQKDKDKDKKGK